VRDQPLLKGFIEEPVTATKQEAEGRKSKRSQAVK
jgi:hypothetical protein